MSANISPSSSDESNLYHLDEAKNTEGIPHPALLNQVIIESIFENLAVDYLRNCRLVCQKWKSVGDLSFKKKVRLCLHFKTNDDGIEVVKGRTDANFPAPRDLAQFFHMSQSEFPFTAVSFKNLLPWLPTELSNFFSTEGRFITDLTLLNVALKQENFNKENDTRVENYELTASLSGMENLKKLALKREKNLAAGNTGWTVSFKTLENIQHIILERCSIVLNTIPLIITPVEFSLTDVIFVRDNTSLKNILLNEIINFDCMEELSLGFTGSPGYSIYTELSLDISGNTVLDKANFYYTNIINFMESSWNVRDLNLLSIPLDKPTKMIIKELSIEDCICSLKVLPNSLEKFSIGRSVYFVEATESTPWCFSRPHIKSLELDHADAIQMCWPHLIKCFPNLEELRIRSFGQNVTIDVRMIPPTVKSLTLQGRYQFIGHGVHALDELKMDFVKGDMDFVLPTLRFFEPKYFRVWGFFLKSEDPVVKALFEISIPRVQLEFFDSENFICLKREYTFDNIDNEKNLGVIVNGKGSIITIRFFQD